MRIGEPAADLAVAAALISALTEQPVPSECVVFGEIGLSGEVRAVSQSDARLKEASKLGFSSALIPPRRGKGGKPSREGAIAVTEVVHLRELVARFMDGTAKTPQRREPARR